MKVRLMTKVSAATLISAIACSIFTGCTEKDLYNPERGKTELKPESEYFDFATTAQVAFDVNYGKIAGGALIEVFTEDPITYQTNNLYSINGEAVFKIFADADGRFTGNVELPKATEKVYIISQSWGVRHNEIAVGLGILLRNGAVNNNGVHLVVHELVDKVVHARETHEIRAGHIAGDEIGLGRAGLRADALAGEGLNAGVLAGLVGLDEDHRRQIGVVGIGEIGGLETLLGDLDGGEDDIGVALLQAGHETVKVHVHDLELLAHIRGDRLGNGDVDTDVLLLVLVVQNDELVRGIVGGGRHDESFAFGRSAAAGSEAQHHEQSQNDCCYLFHFFSFLSIQRE